MIFLDFLGEKPLFLENLLKDKVVFCWDLEERVDVALFLI